MRLLLLLAATVSAVTFANSQSARAESTNLVETMNRRPNQEQLARSKDLPATVVIRINQATGQMEVAQIKDRLAARPMDLRSLDNSLFQPIDLSVRPDNAANFRAGASWLFYFLDGLWNYPTYNYYNYDYGYNSYYNYGYNGWNYSYYGYPYYY